MSINNNPVFFNQNCRKKWRNQALTAPVASPQIWVHVSAKRGMSAPISRSRVHTGCMGGDTRSHPGKSGVRGPAIAEKAKKTLREKRKRKEKAKGKVKGCLKVKAYIARVRGKSGNPKQK